MSVVPREITFFHEQPSAAAEELFRDGSVAEFLAQNGFGVAMGMIDLTATRARIVRDLEARGVPVTAWLLLDRRDGYWLNADNAERAEHRWHETLAWAEREGLQLSRVGLDVEWPHRDGEALMRRPLATVVRLVRTRRSAATVATAERRYAQLVTAIRATGRRVESYQFPFIVDERRAATTLLRRVCGLLDLDVDREVLMLYATYLGNPVVGAYIEDAEGVGLGVTGGGVFAEDPREKRNLLTWTDLEAQMRCAQELGKPVYIFSLEGCVWAGMLPQLAGSSASEPTAAAAPRHPVGWTVRATLRSLLRCEALVDALASGRTPER